MTVSYNGRDIAIDAVSAVPANLRGYVQLPLNLDLINARLTITQGPRDLQPVVRAWFVPATIIKRDYFAVAAGRFSDRFGNN